MKVIVIAVFEIILAVYATGTSETLSGKALDSRLLGGGSLVHEGAQQDRAPAFVA